MDNDERSEDIMRRMSRRSFLWAALAVGGTAGAWQAIVRSPKDKGMLAPLREMSEVNRALWERLFREGSRAPTFDRSLAGSRVNGRVGMRQPVDVDAWRLRVLGLQGGDRVLTLDDLRAMPRTEETTELKCVEGWSQIMNWAGVRFVDFAAAVGPRTISGRPADPLGNPRDVVPYVFMQTPKGTYFVSLDTASALHPQTILAYEKDGAPLSQDHGAPLRLVMPVKYGYKNIKRIGLIRFAEERPKDYWTEDGYDWYAGL